MRVEREGRLAKGLLDFSQHPLAHPRVTYFLKTAISFSILVSFPFSAFLGMHLIATIFPVAFSRAITTSENAPLQENRKKKKKRKFNLFYTSLDNIDIY